MALRKPVVLAAGELQQLQSGDGVDSAVGGVPTGGSTGQALVKTGGANYAASWQSATSSYQQFQSSAFAPTGTTSGTAVMCGLGSGTAINPQVTGRVLLTMTGSVQNNTAGAGGQVQLRYGTGAAPANGAAATGTATIPFQTAYVPIAGSYAPLCLVAIITGLTLGTTYWLDATQRAVGGGTFNLSNVAIAVMEF